MKCHRRGYAKDQCTLYIAFLPPNQLLKQHITSLFLLLPFVNQSLQMMAQEIICLF